MSRAAFVFYAPLDVPKPVAPDIWIVDGPEIRMSLGPIGMPFPTRMTVVRLPEGGLWLHSPVAPDEALLRAIAELGPVRFLIAPNTLHYWWIADWKARFPQAEVHAAPGLAGDARRPLPQVQRLEALPPAGWADAIDQLIVAGDALIEVVFFHGPSRTLILTDLIENFELPRMRGLLMRTLVRLGGAVDPDGKAPLDMRVSFLRHRGALRAAVRRMLAWQPDAVIVAHGRWYPRGGEAELRRAFRWVL